MDLAISPDGTRLYVANSGSTLTGIGVIDLTTLTILPSLPAPFLPTGIAAGLDNRLYVLGNGGNGQPVTGLAQIDATTGDSEAMFPEGSLLDFSYGYGPGFIRISPDHKTLFYGDAGISPGSLASFDVSTAIPAILSQTDTDVVGGDGRGLTISHNGQYLVYPAGGGNGNSGDYTSLIPTNNLNGVLGILPSYFPAGVVTFSGDDSELFQAQEGLYQITSGVSVFNTQTFALFYSFAVPNPVVDTGYGAEITSLALTVPNNYLYVAQTEGTINASFDKTPDYLVLVATQAAPFFNGFASLSSGFDYLAFGDGTPFGYFNFNFAPYFYHSDLGFEYPIDAADGSSGIYLYDFTSQTFFYTSPGLFPYLYDFTLNSFLYYYPDATNPGHYTANPRYFYDFAAGQIITK